MIIQRLRGGVGNQLFQYAAGKALAEKHGTSFKLDLYYYSRHPYRIFELDKLSVPIEIASRNEIHQFTGSNPLIRFLNKRENYFHCPDVFTQPHFHFFDPFMVLPDNLYLSGYWQSEHYFLSIEKKIREWFVPKDDINDEPNLKLIKEIQSCESVSLHVRIGDYTFGKYQPFFGGLQLTYYFSAMQKMNDRLNNPHFFVFSDDPKWCKENLNLNCTYVENNSGSNSYKDLFLMSYCKHNIIANSTFSWWGAWLNSNPNKIVIAPQEWFKQSFYRKKEPTYPVRLYSTKDLYPEKWEIL